MPDAAKAALARGDLGFQHRLDAVAEQEIGVADDAGTDRGGAVAAAGAHRGRAIGEGDLVDDPHFLRSAGAIHRTGLDIDGRDDVVAGGDIAG